MKIVNKLLLTTVGTAFVALSVGTAEVAQAKSANSENYNISDAVHSNSVVNNSRNTSTITLASKPSSINNRLNFRIDTDTIINSFLLFNCLIVMSLCVLEVLLILDEECLNLYK